MKTDDFITMLASGVTPVDRYALAKRFGIAVLIGLVAATLLVMIILGVRSDLAEVAATPIFWAKIAFPLCLMIGAASVVMRLARPGMTPGPGKFLVVAAVAAVWAGALYVLTTATPDVRVAIILGKTWRVCALNITLLSVPGFIAVFWALRGLAPTHLRLAGACGGLLARWPPLLIACIARRWKFRFGEPGTSWACWYPQ